MATNSAMDGYVIPASKNLHISEHPKLFRTAHSLARVQPSQTLFRYRHEQIVKSRGLKLGASRLQQLQVGSGFACEWRP